MEIKRFHALFELVDCALPSFARKPDISVFDNLSKAAGALLDIDTCQAITIGRMKTLDLSEYFNHLKSEELRSRSSFNDTASEFPFYDLSRARPLIYSALSIQSEGNLQEKARKRILKSAINLDCLMDRKKPGDGHLHSIYESVESLHYKMDVWRVCSKKTLLPADIAHRTEKICARLEGWRDLLLAHRSVNEFLVNEAHNDVADSAAYLQFQKELRRRIGHFRTAYKRGHQSLHQSLRRLATEL